MYNGKPKGMFKHLDFALLDFAVMYISFFLVFLLLSISSKMKLGDFKVNAYLVMVYTLANLLAMLFGNSYKNILKRGYGIELYACIAHTGWITLMVIAALYISHQGGRGLRTQILVTFAVYLCLTYICRVFYKKWVKSENNDKNANSLLIITTDDRAEDVVSRMLEESPRFRLKVTGLCILDRDMTGSEIGGIPVVASEDSVLDYACHNWVDEVLFDLDNSYLRPDDNLHGALLDMGITTHVKLYEKSDDYQWDRSVEKVGPYMVLTRSSKIISSKQRVAKRVLDIVGGLVGTLLTGILLIFVGPAIYIQSPGPVFFKQERIGMNGRKFKMYKFRSMVMNADELKQKYMEQNRVSDGMMFKLDWDPRIIGNKELPDGTRKTGLGEFIRKTSIDEFPQFFNVLKGDMSLVGTRPPTVDEWEKYEAHHRGRMAVKPGITGLWQVSGRSKITDFEEVVRLDREYISGWTFNQDLRILLKTVKIVLTREGSM